MVGLVIYQLQGAQDFAPLAVDNVKEKNQVPRGAALSALDVQHWEAQRNPKQEPYTVALENF